MSKALLTSRRFAPVFVCQFFSALNDNLIKNALVMLIVYRLSAETAGYLVPLAGAVLMAPFVVLSALGGELADRFDKARVARYLKLAELPVAVLAAAGLYAQSIPLMFLALALFGIVSALFGPVKYGILPDHLGKHELAAGNAYVEAGTFLAILLGMMLGNLAVATGAPVWLAAAMVAMAALAWASARAIPPTGSAAPDLAVTPNPLRSTARLLAELKADRRLWIGGLITGWFWFVGAAVLSILPLLVTQRIGGTPGIVTLSLALFTVGIALGSALAARASRQRPNMALVPLAALLIALFALDLSWAAAGWMPGPDPRDVQAFVADVAAWRLMFDLVGLAAAGGLFIVPAFAAVQAWAPADRRARVVAACNVLSALFMTAAALILMALQAAGASVPVLFGALGLASLAVLVLVLRAWGREGIKDLVAFVFRATLDLEVKGLENIPAEGTRAIIAPNHVSLLDAAIMHAILPSHATFAIDTAMSEKRWVKPFLKLVRTQPIDPTKPLGTRHLVHLVRGGETLVIFPEGRLTVTGGLMKVYDGTAMIADKADAVIVPIRIEGPERSPFGYLSGRQTRKTWFPKTTVTILPPEKIEVEPSLKGKPRRQAAGARLQDIMVDTAVRCARLDQTVFSAVAEARRTRDTGRPILADPTGAKLSYRKLILSAQVLGRKLALLAAEGEAVGVMLPSSVASVVSFLALQSVGRVPAP